MKRIYDFGRRPARRNHTIADLQALKGSGRKMTMCTPADPTEIRACVEAGIDLLTVWSDRLDEAREVAPDHFMGIGSTWRQFGTADEVLAHAVDLMGRGGDMYYTLRSLDVVELLANEGIPVQSHIGLIPTFSHWAGGLRAFGRTADEALEVYRNLKRLESAGAVAVEVECIAEEVLEAVNERTSVVTISLGSGRAGDVIMSFVADVCGEASEEDTPPKHAHAFGDLARLHDQMYAERVAALKAFHDESTAGNFPYAANNVTMHAGEHEKLLDALDHEA